MSVAEGVFLNFASIVTVGYVFVCSMCDVKLQKTGDPPALPLVYIIFQTSATLR